jgi:hypothetical protein
MNPPFYMFSKRMNILLIFLLFLSTINISADLNHPDEIKEQDDSKYIIREYHGRFHSMPIKCQKKQIIEELTLRRTVIDDDFPFNDIGNQIRPGLCKSEKGTILIFCHDTYYWNITASNSDDNGTTWGDLDFYRGNTSYITPDLWEGEKCFFTAVSNPNTINDGVVYIMWYDIMGRLSTFGFNNIYVGDLGWYGMKDASIACDNSQNWWEFGVASYIMSTTYENEDLDIDGYVDGPTIFHMDPNREDWADIGWWDGIQNCSHCENDIDRITHLHYAVYDYYNQSSGHWEVLIFINDFEEIMDGDLWSGYILAEQGDLERPIVAAHDDHLIILAEYEKNGNKDIICYYSADGIKDLQQQRLFNTSDQEGCPNIFHVENTTFVASFVRNGNIYTTWTMDGGAQWTPPFQVNENQGLVSNTYRSSCLWYPFIVWEEQHQDIDLILKKITMPPDPPSIQGSNTGIIGESYEVTITATHPDELNLSYYIDWGDGSSESWTDPFPFGESVTITHTYDSNQSYQIRGKARNEEGVEGHWAYLMVNIPKNKDSFHPFLRFLENHPRLFPIIRVLLQL